MPGYEYMQRYSTNGGQLMIEDVTWHDPDATEFFRLDFKGWHLKALRRLPLVWNVALVQERGIGENEYETMLATVAVKMEEMMPTITQSPRKYPFWHGGATKMQQPLWDLCELRDGVQCVRAVRNHAVHG